MDHAFRESINKSILVYLDEITIFSQKKYHLQHLWQTFLKCQEFQISLNSKKSIFTMDQENLLGHVISIDGFLIDPERLEAISNFTILSNIKKLQDFLDWINL